MSSAKPAIPASADLPLDGVPAQDVGHHAQPIIDPDIIARLANGFFQQTPVLPAASGLPFGPPVLTPSLPDAPAPAVVTTVAPLAPARSPYGPPDLPQTTIPSVVPTPNIPAPAAPTGLQSPTRPLGLDQIPQPGASLGSSGPSGVSTDIDYSLIPRLLAADMSLAPADHVTTLSTSGYAPTAAPGGLAPAPSDNLYFLPERTAPVSAAPTTSYLHPLTPAVAPQPDLGHPNIPVAAPSAPALAEATAPAPVESFAISGPSEADPHRL
jgi:cysteine desulfurase/selenocysteine lyase